MSAPMEFWGVEVKGKEPCEVEVKGGSIVHISQVTLGEVKKDKETVTVYVHVDEKKLVLALLNQDTPQITCDLVFHEDFEISHNWKNGSIHIIGYQASIAESESDDDSSDEEPVDLPVAKENGQPAAKPKVENKPKPEMTDESDDDSEDDEIMTTGDSDESDDDEEDEDDDEDSGDSEEDDKPVNAACGGKKRPTAEAKTPPKSSKKTKIVTPSKTDSKKGIVHPATPYPKKSEKTPAGDKTDSKKGETSKQKKGVNTPAGDKTPNSGGSDVSCGSCKKTFKSEVALQSHSKAKHSAK